MTKIDRIIELLEKLVQSSDPDRVISFPVEAARWLGQSEDWVKEHQHNLPGVIIESERVKLFHPRTYLERRLSKRK